jgi:hypothetical protein
MDKVLGMYIHFRMSKKRRASSRVSETKAPKTYRLAAAKIARARAILGAPSDTAAIEMALDLVSFRNDLIKGTRAMRGTVIEPFETSGRSSKA